MRALKVTELGYRLPKDVESRVRGCQAKARTGVGGSKVLHAGYMLDVTNQGLEKGMR